MSTDRQIAANRRNADKSTGPTSALGKAASAQNARRHGLTGAPTQDAALTWYRVILEDEAAVPDPFNEDPYGRAAFDLARAEAQLQRVRKAEEEWLQGPKPPVICEDLPTDIEKGLWAAWERLVDALVEDALSRKRLSVAPEGRFLGGRFKRPASEEELDRILEEHAKDPTVLIGWDRKGFGLLRRIENRIARDRILKQVDHRKQGRVLGRYRATAEARRRKALRRWTEEIAKRSQSKQVLR